MTLPFHPSSSHLLPSGMFDFLGNSDLVQLATVNQITRQQSKQQLQKRRTEFLQTLFSYFETTSTYEPHKKTFTLFRQHDINYYPYVKLLFRYLPELFEYIQHHHITYLDFGCIRDYEMYADWKGYRMIFNVSTTLYEIGSQVLSHLKKNTTLYSCNLGLFEHVLSRSNVFDALEGHPTIQSIWMRSSTSRTNFDKEPTTIWRHTDGTYYWAHFRKE